MNAADQIDIDEDFVGRCYTKARRAPLVHGVVRSVNGGPNLRLPFGPYTLTQLAAIVTSVAVLIVSRPLWGGHGAVDVLVLLLIPFGCAFAMRHLHIDGRNPAAAAASVVLMLASPRGGRLHGRALRPVRIRWGAPEVTLGHPDFADEGDGGFDDAAPVRAARPVRPAGSSAPQPSAPAEAMASGVQALLARRTPARIDLET